MLLPAVHGYSAVPGARMMESSGASFVVEARHSTRAGSAAIKAVWLVGDLAAADARAAVAREAEAMRRCNAGRGGAPSAEADFVVRLLEAAAEVEGADGLR